MGRDESATLARLRKNRSEHLDPVFDKYAGRLEHHCARELDQSPVAGQLDLYYARSNSHEAKMRRWLLAVFINVGAAVLAALAFGVWKRLSPDLVDQGGVPTQMEGSIVAGFYDQKLDDVGFIAGANKHVTARKLAGSQVIYDVSYTTGPDHFRVVPEANQAERCVLLFGDSFTFGEGVNDDETSAAQIVIQSKGLVAAKNLGIGGWGAHQFLAGLQSGRFQRAISCRPTDAVFLITAAQIGRVAGRGPWDPHGPLFRLDAKGRPMRAGNFDTAGTSLRELVGLNRLTEGEEEDLEAALIAEGEHELTRLYPGIRFRVFTWAGVADGVLWRLSERRLDVHTMQQLIPDYSVDTYLISPAIEGHPTPRAYERLAAYFLSLK